MHFFLTYAIENLIRMNEAIRDRVKMVLAHLLFWVAVWFFYVYFFSYNSTGKEYILWFSSLILPVTMFATYLTVYKLITKYLLNKRYGYFALYSFYVLVATSYFIVVIIYASLIFILDFKVGFMPPMTKNFISILILVYLVVGLASLYKIVNHNLKTVARNRELQNKVLRSQLQIKEQELSYLKMQIHPHFLFNTLNTIYGYALKQSRQTPDIILKLSHLLDYILYQVTKPQVSIKEEVEHISEYIELEKIRFHDTLDINFNCDIRDENATIAPMLLIPFVENAFKHGDRINGILKVDIYLALTEESLSFKLRNSSTSLKKPNTNSGGIGLENIRKRLELLYPGQFQLKIERLENQFVAELIIENLKPAYNYGNYSMPDS